MDLITASVKDQHPGLIINFVLDESGSMKEVLNQTIEAFNAYVKEQKESLMAKRPNKVFLALTKFESTATVVYGATEIHSVRDLGEDIYSPSDGWTALNDAIGKSIQSVDAIISDWEDKPAVLTVVLTDGRENRSQEFTTSQVRELIASKKSEGWTFVFLGSDPYTQQSSAAYGISEGNTLRYCAANVKGAMRRLSMSTDYYSCSMMDSGVKAECQDFFRDS